MADGKTTFLEVIEVEPEGIKGLWQRLTLSVRTWLRDEEEEPALPRWVPRTARRVTTYLHKERPPGYCPIHHIELPATGQCDECS
jgi:hypothetical protein